MDTSQYNILNHFEKIYLFLMKYFTIWEKEVLNYYPESYQNFPKHWIKLIHNLSEHERWLIDSKKML